MFECLARVNQTKEERDIQFEDGNPMSARKKQNVAQAASGLEKYEKMHNYSVENGSVAESLEEEAYTERVSLASLDQLQRKYQAQSNIAQKPGN
jgi:hypothetical protein